MYATKLSVLILSFCCRVVKLTSPNLNYFLIAGTYIMYTAVFLRLISSTLYEFNYARCIVSHLVEGILHIQNASGT